MLEHPSGPLMATTSSMAATSPLVIPMAAAGTSSAVQRWSIRVGAERAADYAIRNLELMSGKSSSMRVLCAIEHMAEWLVDGSAVPASTQLGKIFRSTAY